MDFTTITKILEEKNKKGGFLASLIVDREGFPIASITNPDSEQDLEIQAALLGLVRRATSQASQEFGLSNTTEFTLFDENGYRFVCRLFSAGETELALAFLIPDKDLSYRRLMQQTIKTVQKVLEI